MERTAFGSAYRPGGDEVLARSAAVLAWSSGLGFGLPGLYAIAHLVRHGEIATFLGYPTYGHGVFENRCGIRTTVPLLSAFVVVCAAECGAGALLWHQRRAGAALALVLLPAETVFWVGFSLPYGPVAAAARTALVLRYRRRVPGRARKLA
ncbi:hypothetical protein A4U64_03310 [Rhodococcus sp. WB1]|uniref:hypothetical protein n=1 Tax=Rhodococcus TaxID=1827 RepID=UPI00081A3B2A|nr:MULTISPECIES: hypothetical protein [Rhodococcus]ANZ23836.1 hypothetical protein A4U64_03310 [Rhodococcus sp. WB1]UGQ42374.1 hypothetical protein LRQ66_03315 [Rhodococcus aetherivorans]